MASRLPVKIVTESDVRQLLLSAEVKREKVKVIKEEIHRLVKTTKALPLKRGLPGILEAVEGKVGGLHKCGWDTEDENVRAHLLPGWWDAIHRVCALAPKSKAHHQNAIFFLMTVAMVLPCESCRLKFAKRIFSVLRPLTNISAKDLFLYSVELHNEVNKERGVCEYSLEQAVLRYGYKY